MARLRPPQHPVDETEIEYIHNDDDAWDRERIESELNRMDEDDWSDHPFTRYFAGLDRFSMDAPSTFRLQPEEEGGETESVTATVGDYLDRSKDPEVWVVRRIDELDYARKVLPLERRGDLTQAHIEAVRRGLVKVDNGPKLDCNKSGKATPSANDIRVVIREGLLEALGTSIVTLSRPLTPAEKKRFASSPGHSRPS